MPKVPSFSVGYFSADIAVVVYGRSWPLPMRSFFLPYQGEFGWYISSFIRIVHAWPAESKIVSCRPDHRCLFPTASGFFHDYPELLKDEWKCRTSEGRWTRRQMDALRKEVCEKYSEYQDCDFVAPFTRLDLETDAEIIRSRFKPSIQRRGLKCDVAITPRRRDRSPRRNLPFWQEIVDGLRQHGYSVGCVGEKQTSYHLERIAMRSWDHGGLEATIEILSEAKLVLAQNTGTAHFAVFLECPTIVMKTGSGMIYLMEAQRNPNVHFQVIEASPKAALAAALWFLERQG